MYYKNKLLWFAVSICCFSVVAVSSLQAFTINGATAPARMKGVPLGGMGSGSFNFLPNGTYDRQYCQIQPATGMEPTIMVYTERGATKWSTQALTTAAGMGITYTGYWPKVTNVYANASMTINLTLEAFSPLYPGSNKNCSMPLAFFVFTLENTAATAVTAAVACRNNATASVISSGGKVRGIVGNNITMMVKNSDTTAQVTSGATVADFTADGLLSNVAGGILASLVVLQPSQKKTITFVIAWDNINGQYRKYLTTSQLIAQYGYNSADTLKSKVDNWHNKILGSNLPDWYKDVLINNCHVLNSMYTWYSNDSCTMRETMSAAGAEGCFDQRYYSSIIVPLFAPDAEFQEMKLFAKHQAASGQIPHGTDGGGDKSDINSEFSLCLLRDYQWTGEQRFLDSMYANAKRALFRNRNWDTDKDGLTDGTYSTFDQPMYDGWMPIESEYCGDIWLAAIKAGGSMADWMGDAAMFDSCKAWLTQTSASFEKINGQHGFWNTTTAGPTGLRGYYTASNDITSNSGKGLASWASQLGGQWYADLLQLGRLHPQGRIDSAIQYIEALNKGDYGYYLAILPAKTNWFGKWPGTNACGEQWPWFPPAHFGHPAISNGFPDIGLDCVNRQWKSNYSGQVAAVGPIPWSSPVFMMVNGTDASDTWGRYRYMNPPGVFTTLFAITGFSVDIASRKIWIKPSIPTSLNKKLIKAPLINPVSCGTLDYEEKAPYGQVVTLAFDDFMQFEHITLKDQNTAVVPKVEVVKNSVQIPCTVTRNGTGKSAEISLYFMSGGLAIDANGVQIIISDSNTVSTRYAAQSEVTGRNAKLFKSLNSDLTRLAGVCSQNDMVEIYDLRGKMLIKGTFGSIVKEHRANLPKGLAIFRIVQK